MIIIIRSTSVNLPTSVDSLRMMRDWGSSMKYGGWLPSAEFQMEVNCN